MPLPPMPAPLPALPALPPSPAEEKTAPSPSSSLQPDEATVAIKASAPSAEKRWAHDRKRCVI
jgi:hypothetical protein